jgi:hypothetical protein
MTTGRTPLARRNERRGSAERRTLFERSLRKAECEDLFLIRLVVRPQHRAARMLRLCRNCHTTSPRSRLIAEMVPYGGRLAEDAIGAVGRRVRRLDHTNPSNRQRLAKPPCCISYRDRRSRRGPSIPRPHRPSPHDSLAPLFGPALHMQGIRPFVNRANAWLSVNCDLTEPGAGSRVAPSVSHHSYPRESRR